MKRTKKITPQIQGRAKEFHNLITVQKKSVAEAAEEMGISKETIYEEAQLYAEINGVPSKEKPSRFFYIKDYKARAKGLIVERIVEKNFEAETPKPISETPDEEPIDHTSTIDKAIEASFNEITDKCEYSIGLMVSKIEECKQRLNRLQEENV